MQKPRLTRLELLFTGYPVYFLTACSAERRKILANPAIHEAFLRFAERGLSCGVWVGRYVVMPDHLHLFAAFRPEGLSVSKWMKSMKNSLSKSLRLQGTAGPHWQKGFFDHVMRSKESYREKWEYVQQNPVRAGLVASAEDWPYQGEVQRFSTDRL